MPTTLSLAGDVSPHLLPKPAARRRAARKRNLYLPNVTGMNLPTAALVYAEAGWFVFPVRPGTKKPAIANWDENSSRDLKICVSSSDLAPPSS